MIVAYPEAEQSAAELCHLYRAKDEVEQGFRVIKSVVKLRPVFHQTEAKVRAHVTLCMLALALERTLTRRLKSTSAQMALEILSTCSLNRFEDRKHRSHYLTTTPDPQQRALLRELKLEHLVDDTLLAERLRPR